MKLNYTLILDYRKYLIHLFLKNVEYTIQCQTGKAETIGLLDLLLAILEQNMNNNKTDDNKKSLNYVLISCIPTSSTSIFLPYLFLLSTKYPSRYSSIDTSLSKLDAISFELFPSSWCGPSLKIVKKEEDQSLRTLCTQKENVDS